MKSNSLKFFTIMSNYTSTVSILNLTRSISKINPVRTVSVDFLTSSVTTPFGSPVYCNEILTLRVVRTDDFGGRHWTLSKIEVQNRRVSWTTSTSRSKWFGEGSGQSWLVDGFWNDLQLLERSFCYLLKKIFYFGGLRRNKKTVWLLVGHTHLLDLNVKDTGFILRFTCLSREA